MVYSNDSKLRHVLSYDVLYESNALTVGSLSLECKLGRRLHLTSTIADDCFIVGNAFITASTPQRFVDALPQSTLMNVAKVAVSDAWLNGVCLRKNDHKCLADDDRFDAVEFLVFKTDPLTVSMFQVNSLLNASRSHIGVSQSVIKSAYARLSDLIIDKAISPIRLVELYCQHRLQYADKQENDV